MVCNFMNKIYINVFLNCNFMKKTKGLIKKNETFFSNASMVLERII